MNTYETEDINVATFLSYMGYHPTILKTETSQKTFLFDNDQNKRIHKLVEAYWKKTPIAISPADLFASQRHLKSLIRQN